MFCKNCGNEISNNSKFCGKCGTPIQQTATANNAASSNLQINNSLSVLFLAATAMHILEIIFWFIRCIKATGLGIVSESISMHSLFGDTVIFSVITVIFCLISAVLCILPVISNNTSNFNRLIFPKITTLWVFAWFLIALISALIDSNDSYGMVKISLTFGGWLLTIVSIASIVLLFMISSKTKKMKSSNN